MEAPKTPAQIYALIAGAFLLALGVLSLIIVGVDFGTISGTANPDDFIIWEATGWTSILWIAAGALGLLMMARVDTARTYALAAGIAFAVIAVWGFIDGNDVASIFAAGTTNNITHAIIGGLGLVIGLMPGRHQRKAGVATEPREERFSREPATRRDRERMR